MDFQKEILNDNKIEDLLTLLKETVKDSAIKGGSFEILIWDMIFEEFGYEEEDLTVSINECMKIKKYCIYNKVF